VLHVAACADDDPVEIAPQHAVVPNASLRADLDVSDQPRTGRNEGSFVDARCLAAIGDDRRTGMWAHRLRIARRAAVKTSAKRRAARSRVRQSFAAAPVNWRPSPALRLGLHPCTSAGEG